MNAGGGAVLESSLVDFFNTGQHNFLEACAITGMTTLASITPNILTEENKKELNRVFKIADKGGLGYKIVNFDKNANPEEFISPNGEYIRFDWDEHYNGSRNVVDWFE